MYPTNPNGEFPGVPTPSDPNQQQQTDAGSGGAIDGIGAVAEGAGEVVGAAAEGVGSVLEGVGGLLEGCSGCSLVILAVLFFTAQSAFAMFR